jgi:salicylate hydroxylase
MKDLAVVIVGAGIGGLQAALALAHDGHNVTLLESAKAFEEVCKPIYYRE